MDEQLNAPMVFEETDEPLAEGSEPVSKQSNEGATTPEMVDVEISRFFGYRPGDAIDNADRDYMQTIWNYYAQGLKTAGEVIRKISQAERSIAPPMPGETRLGKFYTYVRLLEESNSVRDEITAYKK